MTYGSEWSEGFKRHSSNDTLCGDTEKVREELEEEEKKIGIVTKCLLIFH